MFSMTDIITKKKNGEKLSEQQIRDLIDGYVNGDIPDYQMSALLMAIYFNGMDEDEIYILTDAMKNSGEVIDLTDIKGNKVDKHSSGGVGDKLSLTACPVAAAAGVKIAPALERIYQWMNLRQMLTKSVCQLSASRRK